MKARLIIGAALVAALGTGCLTSRSIRGVTEHGSRNLTYVQTSDVWSYGFYAIAKHQFWNCKTEGDTLTCKKTCDAKDSDLDCPMGLAVDSGSNTISAK